MALQKKVEARDGYERKPYHLTSPSTQSSSCVCFELRSTRTCYVSVAGLKLLILLPQPPQCCNYRHVSLYLAVETLSTSGHAAQRKPFASSFIHSRLMEKSNISCIGQDKHEESSLNGYHKSWMGPLTTLFIHPCLLSINILSTKGFFPPHCACAVH